MEVQRLSPNTVLQPQYIQEYKSRIQYLYLSQIVPLNANVFILEKITGFPFSLFTAVSENIFFTMVYRNFFDISLLIISRLLNDEHKDFFTFMQFKRWLLQAMKPEYESNFRQWLKEIKFDKDVNALLARTKHTRDSFIAHIKYPLTENEIQRLHFQELIVLRDEINQLLSALSFDTERIVLPIAYQPSFQNGTTDIERILDNIARESYLLNLPETDSSEWEARKIELSTIAVAEINKYRIKFDLPIA